MSLMNSRARAAVLVMALLAIGALQRADAQVVAGLWQMHERDLWIQVNVDGSALRCWVVGEESAVVVRGVLQSARTIKWKSALGTEEVEFRRDSLTAKSTYGLLTFVPAEDVMPASCRAQS